MLFASANILAQNGQQQSCEDVLATTRDVYKLYAANMHSSGLGMVDVPGWRQQQIAAAEPVTSKSGSFRSDELLDTEVRSASVQADEELVCYVLEQEVFQQLAGSHPGIAVTLLRKINWI